MIKNWLVYVNWNAISPMGIWHYEEENPNRRPIGKHWTLLKSDLHTPCECIDFIEGETGRAIFAHICEINDYACVDY